MESLVDLLLRPQDGPNALRDVLFLSHQHVFVNFLFFNNNGDHSNYTNRGNEIIKTALNNNAGGGLGENYINYYLSQIYLDKMANSKNENILQDYKNILLDIDYNILKKFKDSAYNCPPEIKNQIITYNDKIYTILFSTNAKDKKLEQFTYETEEFLNSIDNSLINANNFLTVGNGLLYPILKFKSDSAKYLKLDNVDLAVLKDTIKDRMNIADEFGALLIGNKNMLNLTDCVYRNFMINSFGNARALNSWDGRARKETKKDFTSQIQKFYYHEPFVEGLNDTVSQIIKTKEIGIEKELLNKTILIKDARVILRNNNKI